MSSSRLSVIVVVRLKFLSGSSGNMRTFPSRVVNHRRVCNRKSIHSVLEKSMHWMGKNWNKLRVCHSTTWGINSYKLFMILFSIITFHSEHWAVMLRCHASFPYVFCSIFQARSALTTLLKKERKIENRNWVKTRKQSKPVRHSHSTLIAHVWDGKWMLIHFHTYNFQHFSSLVFVLGTKEFNSCNGHELRYFR